nr:hypothetical protein [Lentilactobacillus otakiensis]
MIRKAVHDTNALLIITILFGILSIPLDMIFQRKIQIFDLVQTFFEQWIGQFYGLHDYPHNCWLDSSVCVHLIFFIGSVSLLEVTTIINKRWEPYLICSFNFER